MTLKAKRGNILMKEHLHFKQTPLQYSQQTPSQDPKLQNVQI